MKYKEVHVGTYKSKKELIPGLDKSISKSDSALKIKKKSKKHY